MPIDKFQWSVGVTYLRLCRSTSHLHKQLTGSFNFTEVRIDTHKSHSVSTICKLQNLFYYLGRCTNVHVLTLGKGKQPIFSPFIHLYTE